MRFLKPLLLLFVIVQASAAMAAEPSPEFRRRAAELVPLLNGELPPERFFSPAFLAKVPAATVRQVGEQLKASHGKAKAVAGIVADNATSGTVAIEFERALVRMRMSIAPAPPNLVEGLLVTGVEAKGATVGEVFGAIASLPGTVSLEAARLADGGPQPFLTQQTGRPLAVGSAFKLFILAELVREVKAGERHWSDVVPPDAGPPPSGPPVTLQSLATLMISKSDNAAADRLLALAGREKVERLLPSLGVKEPKRNRPFLATREAFLLKAGGETMWARWAGANEAARRAILTRELAGKSLDGLDFRRFAGRPLAIGQVEWFASASDLVRTLDWLRRSGDATALDILAVNPGLPALKGDYTYVGFKGGSEAGVLNLSFLLRRKDGTWIAFSVSWNNAAAPVDEGRLVAQVERLLALLAKA